MNFPNIKYPLSCSNSNFMNQNVSSSEKNIEISDLAFCGKSKCAKKLTEAMRAYVTPQINNAKKAVGETLKVVKERVAGNGAKIEYLENGSIMVDGSKSAGIAKDIAAKSIITKDVTSSNLWKSNPKRKSFEEAASYLSVRNAGSPGIKMIEGTSKEGKDYISRGYTHELKVKGDIRLFGKQNADKTYEWSLIEHSKLH